MPFLLLFTICVVALAALAFFLEYNWGDKFTLLQKVATALSFLAISFFTADYLKPSEENTTAHLTHNPKELIFAHYYVDAPEFNGRIGLAILQMNINNTTQHSLTVKSADLQFDDLEGHTYTEQSQYIYTGKVMGRPTILFTSKNGIKFFMEDWHNLADRLQDGKLLSPGEIFEASAFYLLPTSTIAEIHSYKHFRIVVTDFADHISYNPIELLDTMGVPGLYNKPNPFEPQ